jgi:hypothetical protein
MSIRVRSGLISDGFMSRRRRCQEILADIGGNVAILVRALEALANVQEGCVGTSGLVSGGVTAVSPVVTSVAGRNNCGCLDDLFYLCTGVADALGNSIVLANRSAEVRV